MTADLKVRNYSGRHSRESGNPGDWMPACAGMTMGETARLKSYQGSTLFGAILLLLVFSACGESHPLSLLEKFEQHAVEPAAEGVSGLAAPPLNVDTVPANDAGDRPFFVIARRKELTQYPCQSCHGDTMHLDPSLDEAVAAGSTCQSCHGDKAPTERFSHWHIELKHADAKVMQCATCHNYQDMNNLKTLNGAPVSFDHAYQVCRSCHFQQFKDWAGGAHGKRYKYWQGPRVSMNCTGCHNPHDPGFKSRWPVTYPSIPRRYE